MTASRRSAAFLLLAAGCTAPLVLAEAPPEEGVVPFLPESPSDASQGAADAASSDSGQDDDGGFDGISNVEDASQDAKR
ncbi:MAG: hypothetical protein KIS78_23150 [Labilithrix sp.]|nr:hypothetical protein [Labilithrix sp.]MCW5835317.1 hypothetical protein [Labilithrix sp.]